MKLFVNLFDNRFLKKKFLVVLSLRKMYNRNMCEIVPRRCRSSNIIHNNDQFPEDADLSRAMQKVRRQRQKRKENTIWSQYCYTQLEKLLSPINNNDPSVEECLDGKQKAVETIEKHTGDCPHFVNKINVGSSEPKCVCECLAKKEDKLTTDMSEYLLKTNQKKTLGYSHMTVISSHRTDQQSERTVDPAEKLKSIRQKLKQIIELIGTNLNVLRIPEDSLEMTKIQNKAIEFCGRFSRNHLYQIGRHLNETTKTLNYCLPFSQWKQCVTQSKNIINLHQILLQAFSMFQRHMRIVWGFGSTQEKLHTLIQLALEINRVCIPQHDTSDISFIEFEQVCQKIIEALMKQPDEHNSCHSGYLDDYHFASPTVRSRKIQSADSRTIPNMQCPNDLSFHLKNIRAGKVESTISGDRFSMYRKKIQPVKALTNKKGLNAESTKQNNTTSVKLKKSKSWHRPNKTASAVEPKRIKSSDYCCHKKCLSNKDYSVKHTQNPSEMEIKITTKPSSFSDRNMESTMGGIIYSKHSNPKLIHEPSEVFTSSCCSAADDEEFLIKQKTHPTKSFRDTETSTDCGGLVDASGRENSSGAVAGGVKICEGRGVGRGAARSLKINPSSSTVSNGEMRNVKLVVMSHDDSLEDYKSEISKVKNSKDNHHQSDNKTRFSKEFHREVLKEVTPPNNIKKSGTRFTEKSVQVEELNNSELFKKRKEPKKLIVPPDIADDFHNYRMEFIKHLSKDPMYGNAEIKRPWEIVSKLSDKLIDDAIATVTEELEMDALLKHMIDVELKDTATT